MKKEMDDILEEIQAEDPRYHIESYEFVLDALSVCQKRYRRLHHVTGQELLETIKELLMERFGPMTLTVLEHWGIKETEDFGNIVFNLVNKKVLSKTEDDKIEHFKNVFDFDVVFNKGYRRRLNKRISQMR